MAIGLHTDISSAALPTELWHLIVSYLNKRSLKKLRMVNKLMHSIATPYIFRVIRFDLTEEITIRNLIQIASHDQLRKHVRRLVLHKRHGLHEFHGVLDWERNFYSPDATGQVQRTTLGDERDIIYNDEEEEEEMMTISEWDALEHDERRKLYDEYEVERCKIQAQTYVMMRHWFEQVFEHPHRWRRDSEEVTDAKTDAKTEVSIEIEDIDMAVLALENLDELSHIPVDNDPTWGRRWGRLRFDFKNFIPLVPDTRFESLQLAVSLVALGKANSIGHNIRSLNLYIPARAFWTPDQDITAFPYALNNHVDVADMHRQLSESSTSEKDCLSSYSERLSAAKLSFVYLTYLSCELNTITDINPRYPKILTGFLKLIQQTSNNLEHLNIKMNDSMVIYPTKAYSQKVCGNEFLNQLPMACKPWKKLARVELQVFTDVASIMNFLIFVAETLRELKLNQVRIPECGGTLRDLVTQISENLHQLRVLDIYKSGSRPFIWNETITFDR